MLRQAQTGMMGSVALSAGTGPPVARNTDPHPGPQRMNHTKYLEESEAPGIYSTQLSVPSLESPFLSGVSNIRVARRWWSTKP